MILLYNENYKLISCPFCFFIGYIKDEDFTYDLTTSIVYCQECNLKYAINEENNNILLSSEEKKALSIMNHYLKENQYEDQFNKIKLKIYSIIYIRKILDPFLLSFYSEQEQSQENIQDFISHNYSLEKGLEYNIYYKCTKDEKDINKEILDSYPTDIVEKNIKEFLEHNQTIEAEDLHDKLNFNLGIEINDYYLKPDMNYHKTLHILCKKYKESKEENIIFTIE